MMKTKKFVVRRVGFVILGILLIVIAFQNKDKIANKIKGEIIVPKVEEVVEVEETKETLDGVILFMDSHRKFVCYQIIYNGGKFDVATSLQQLVDTLNDKTGKLYVQKDGGTVQEVDTETKTVRDIMMVTAISDDLM